MNGYAIQFMNIELIPAKVEDAKIVFDSWGKNANNFKYLSATPQQNVNDASNYLKNALTGNNSVFHIIDSTSGSIVGLIKAKVEGHKALIGYVVDESFWGRGIATIAVKKLVEILNGNEAIERIWAACATNNLASAKVLEKSGFKKEGIFKKWIVYPAQGNQSHDNFVFVWQKDA